jgi:hypothetical protein
MEDFQESMGGPAAGQVMGDVPNYFSAAPGVSRQHLVASST